MGLGAGGRAFNTESVKVLALPTVHRPCVDHDGGDGDVSRVLANNC